MENENVVLKYPLALIYTTSNLIVTRGRCLFLGAWVAGDGANGDCQIYDGVSTNDPQKVHLEALSGTTFALVPPAPVIFERGIYLVVSAATTKVTIAYSSI